jgi:hypothetical protein
MRESSSAHISPGVTVLSISTEKKVGASGLVQRRHVRDAARAA